MGTWNYRVIKKPEGNEDLYAIYEVYYDSIGQPRSYSVEPCTVYTDSIEDLENELQRLQSALSNSILTLEDFPREIQ
jgi:hypothetical protein